jgi:hypothetical protein
MKKWCLLLSVIMVAIGCHCEEGRSQHRQNVSTHTTTTRNISTQSHLLKAEDLDLQTIVSMIKSNKVNGAKELENAINHPKSGINNVDIDNDGIKDYISVKERRANNGIHLDMKAIPSMSKNPEESVVVASVSFSKNTSTNEVRVSGGYPNYVHGYQHHHYGYRHHGLTFGEAMFLSWLFMPRPMYYRPYYFRTIGYSPSRVYSPSQVRSVRTTYRTQTKVSPVRKTNRPKNYSIKSAKKMPSRFKKQLNKGGGFKNRAGQSRKFTSRAGVKNSKANWGSNKSKSKSSGWGSSKSKSSGWGSSKPKSSGWGSSKSKSSGWGSSKSKSSGWGSSSSTRSRSSGWGSSRSSSRSSSGRKSDLSFKKDIITIDNPLAKIKSLRGVYFHWRKGEDDKRHVGVIAQEVRKNVPEVVSKDEDGYRVDYAALVPLLIEGMKELSEQNRIIVEKCSQGS